MAEEEDFAEPEDSGHGEDTPVKADLRVLHEILEWQNAVNAQTEGKPT